MKSNKIHAILLFQMVLTCLHAVGRQPETDSIDTMEGFHTTSVPAGNVSTRPEAPVSEPKRSPAQQAFRERFKIKADRNTAGEDALNAIESIKDDDSELIAAMNDPKKLTELMAGIEDSEERIKALTEAWEAKQMEGHDLTQKAVDARKGIKGAKPLTTAEQLRLKKLSESPEFKKFKDTLSATKLKGFLTTDEGKEWLQHNFEMMKNKDRDKALKAAVNIARVGGKEANKNLNALFNENYPDDSNKDRIKRAMGVALGIQENIENQKGLDRFSNKYDSKDGSSEKIREAAKYWEKEDIETENNAKDAKLAHKRDEKGALTQEAIDARTRLQTSLNNPYTKKWLPHVGVLDDNTAILAMGVFAETTKAGDAITIKVGNIANTGQPLEGQFITAPNTASGRAEALRATLKSDPKANQQLIAREDAKLEERTQLIQEILSGATVYSRFKIDDIRNALLTTTIIEESKNAQEGTKVTTTTLYKSNAGAKAKAYFDNLIFDDIPKDTTTAPLAETSSPEKTTAKVPIFPNLNFSPKLSQISRTNIENFYNSIAPGGMPLNLLAGQHGIPVESVNELMEKYYTWKAHNIAK